MNKTIALAITAILLCASAARAQESPKVTLPIFPGGEPTIEVNMTSEDILPMAKALFPMVSPRLGELADKVSPEDVADILKNVRRVQVLQLDITSAKVSEGEVANYYAKNLPTGAWSRVYWQSSPKTGMLAVYAQGGVEALYAFRVRTVASDGKPVKRVEAGSVEGKIDFIKLLSMAGKLMAKGAAAGVTERAGL